MYTSTDEIKHAYKIDQKSKKENVNPAPAQSRKGSSDRNTG